MRRLGGDTLCWLTLVVTAFGLGSTQAWAQAADPAMSPEWSNVRKALEKYQDPVVALREHSDEVAADESRGAGDKYRSHHSIQNFCNQLDVVPKRITKVKSLVIRDLRLFGDLISGI